MTPRTFKTEVVVCQVTGRNDLGEFLPDGWEPGTPVLVVADPPDGEFRRVGHVPADWEWQNTAGRWVRGYECVDPDATGYVLCRPVPVPEPATVRVETLDAIAQRRKMKRDGVVHTADKLIRNRSSLSGVSVWSRGGVWLADPDDDGMVVVLADPVPADTPAQSKSRPQDLNSGAANASRVAPADTPSEDKRPLQEGWWAANAVVAARLRDDKPQWPCDTEGCPGHWTGAEDCTYVPAPSVVSSAGSPDTGRWELDVDGDPVWRSAPEAAASWALTANDVLEATALPAIEATKAHAALVALVRRDRPQPTAEQVERASGALGALRYALDLDAETKELAYQQVKAVLDACRTEGTGE